MRDAPWNDIFKLDASAADSELCEWVHAGIDVYITHRKYQVKPHSSPRFSSACVAAILHRNHFFCLCQQNKSKVKLGKASNRCQRILEDAELAYVLKTKEFITSQELGSWDFCRIANGVLNKDRSVIPPLSNGPEVLPSASDKAKFFVTNFSTKSNLETQASLYPFPLLELI